MAFFHVAGFAAHCWWARCFLRTWSVLARRAQDWGREGVQGGIRGFLSGTSTVLGLGLSYFLHQLPDPLGTLSKKSREALSTPNPLPWCLGRDPSQHLASLVEPSRGAARPYPAQDSLPTELPFLVACGLLILTFLEGSSKGQLENGVELCSKPRVVGRL